MPRNASYRSPEIQNQLMPKRKSKTVKMDYYVHYSDSTGQRISTTDGGLLTKEMKENLFLPALDRILKEIENRCADSNMSLLSAVQSLLMPDCNSFLDFESMYPIVKKYGPALSLNVQLLKHEVALAKIISSNEKTSSFETFISKLDLMAFSNLSKCTRVTLTFPTTSVTCERSFSTLRYIKNYLRNRSSNERTRDLVLL